MRPATTTEVTDMTTTTVRRPQRRPTGYPTPRRPRIGPVLMGLGVLLLAVGIAGTVLGWIAGG
jgi:hypothetical protein